MVQSTPESAYPHVVRDPAVRGGQPVVQGTRIPVAVLVRSHQLGLDFDEILIQYPSLTPASLHAALAYYFDHKAEIDALIEQADEPPENAAVIEV
jgi:uncharacterized protein (DUF433 family)